MLPALLSTISFIARHPLNRGRPIEAVGRFLRWQVGSRLLRGAVAVPFVDSTRLLVAPGMTGATQNIYCGLHEFEDMAFVLHALRPDDLFVDIGANVGTYTVLAAGAVGCRCIAFEPLPSTYDRFYDNIRLNDISALVTAHNMAIGPAPGRVRFTSSLDTMNHVLARAERDDQSVEVSVEPLDHMLRGELPTVIKVDVEGYETEVLSGASDAFRNKSLLAVLIEFNGSGLRYGYDEAALHRRLLDWGFSAAWYDPFARTVSPQRLPRRTSGNSLYLRDFDAVRARVGTARRFSVLGRTI